MKQINISVEQSFKEFIPIHFASPFWIFFMYNLASLVEQVNISIEQRFKKFIPIHSVFFPSHNFLMYSPASLVEQINISVE